MEDKIRSLCSKIVAANEDADILAMVTELRQALHERVEQIRAKMRSYPVLIERRNYFPFQTVSPYLENTGLAPGENTVTQPLPFTPICSICGKLVELEKSKTDSNAEAVHEECYAAKLTAKKPSTKEKEVDRYYAS
jgi:hypothetical protein